MALLRSCPQGHQWQEQAEAGQEANGRTCPICGSPSVATELDVAVSKPAAAATMQKPAAVLKAPVTSVFRDQSLPTDLDQASAVRPRMLTQLAAPSEEATPALPASSATQASRPEPASASPQTGLYTPNPDATAGDDSAMRNRGWISNDTSPLGPPAAITGPKIPNYRILGELGRGGMGVVYKARQLGLNRIVALKMILAGGSASQHDLDRFLIEAEAVAQMQHPNIVQIYEINSQREGPWFSLEYVDGGSLAHKIGGQPQPPRQAAQLMETLARAMHYAHQRNIIHRDLKPGNVLLTSSGVPKITDFGLAKRLEGDSSQTRTGTVLGTPSYMAPEQAEGKVSQVGPLSDLYALGAMLYDLLTGRPPFKGASPIETLVQVKMDEPVPPRRLQPKIPPDLETICLKCLQKERHKRYASADALAEDLRRFLAHEPIKARPASLIELAWKWTKRRPELAGIIGLLSAIVVALPIAGFLYAGREHGQRLVADQLREQAENANEEAERQKTIALQQEKLAKANFERAREAVNDLTVLGHRELANVPGMENVRRRMLTKGLTFHQQFLKEQSKEPSVRHEAGRAYLQAGHIHEMLHEQSLAGKAYQSSVEIFAGLAAEFPQQPEYRLGLADSHNALGVWFHDGGSRDQAAAEFDRALAIKQKLVEEFPQKSEFLGALATSYNDLGNLFQTNNQLQEAEGVFRRAKEFFEKVAGQFPREPAYQLQLARTELNRGSLLVLLHQAREAQNSYHAALKILTSLAETSSKDKDYQKELGRTYINLGVLLEKSGNYEEAEKNERLAKNIFSTLADKYPDAADYSHLLALGCNNLGELLYNKGNLDEAKKTYDEALDLYGKLRKKSPETPIYRQELARTYHNQSLLFVKKGQLDEAEQAQSQALGLRQGLQKEFSNENQYLYDLACNYKELGIVLIRKSFFQKAKDSFGKAIDISERLESQYPSVALFRQEMGAEYYNLAKMLDSQNKGQGTEASRIWRKALQTQEQLAADFPDAEFKADLARSLKELAKSRFDRNAPEAVRNLQEAVKQLKAALVGNAQPAAYQRELAECFSLLIEDLASVRDHAGVSKTAAELAQSLPSSGRNLYQAAVSLVRCMALVDKDEKISPDKGQQLFRSYGLQAIDLLHKAGAAVPKEELKNNPQLDPLRSHPEFNKAFRKLLDGK